MQVGHDLSLALIEHLLVVDFLEVLHIVLALVGEAVVHESVLLEDVFDDGRRNVLDVMFVAEVASDTTMEELALHLRIGRGRVQVLLVRFVSDGSEHSFTLTLTIYVLVIHAIKHVHGRR